jgi:hypothetical protein
MFHIARVIAIGIAFILLDGTDNIGFFHACGFDTPFFCDFFDVLHFHDCIHLFLELICRRRKREVAGGKAYMGVVTNCPHGFISKRRKQITKYYSKACNKINTTFTIISAGCAEVRRRLTANAVRPCRVLHISVNARSVLCKKKNAAK